MPGAGTTDGHIKLAAVSAADKQTPLFNKKIDWDDNRLVRGENRIKEEVDEPSLMGRTKVHSGKVTYDITVSQILRARRGRCGS